MWLILLGGFLLAIISIAQLAIKSINLTPVIIAGAGAVFLLGVSGFLSGVSSALEAVAYSPPDMKTQMLTAGISMAINTLSLASLICFFAMLLGAVAVIVQTLHLTTETRAQ